jgi:hypothetical protein
MAAVNRIKGASVKCDPLSHLSGLFVATFALSKLERRGPGCQGSSQPIS